MMKQTITRKQLVRLATEMFVTRGQRRSYVTIGDQRFYLRRNRKQPVQPAKPDNAELTYMGYLAANEIPLSGDTVLGEGVGRLLFDVFYCPDCRTRLVESPQLGGSLSLCPKCGQHSPPLKVGGKEI